MSERNNLNLRNSSPKSDENTITNATYSKIMNYTKLKEQLQNGQPEKLLKICYEVEKKLERERSRAIEALNLESDEASTALTKIIESLVSKSMKTHMFLVNCIKVENNPSFNVVEVMEEAEKLVISSDIVSDIQKLSCAGNLLSFSPEMHGQMELLQNIQKKIEKQEVPEMKPYVANDIESSDSDDDDIWSIETFRKVLPSKNPSIIRQMVNARQNSMNGQCSSADPPMLKIMKRMIPNTYHIDVDVISIIDFKEFFVRDRYPLKKEEDDAFIMSLQTHYAHTFNCQELPNPRVDSPGAVKIDDIWYRCRVISVNKEYEVLLIDAGRYENVKADRLMILDRMFYDHNEIALKCSMADVKPIESYDFPERAYEVFRTLTFNSRYDVKIFTLDEIPANSDKAVPVILYVCGIKNNKKIRFNSYMVQYQYAKSTGKGSNSCTLEVDSEAEEQAQAISLKRNEEKELMKLKNDCYMKFPPVTRVPVRILSVISPSEFYISTEYRDEEIMNFQRSMQWKLKPNDVERHNDINWNCDDKCLVYHSLNDRMKEWMRAVVIKKKFSENVYTLFLIDFGCEINSDTLQMIKMPEQFKAEPAGAIKVHLFGTTPPTNTAEEWPQGTLELFNRLTKMFKSYFVSVFLRDHNAVESIPVLLWGGTKKNVITMVFHNIPLYMYNQGFVDTKVKLGIVENLVNPFDLSFAKSNSHSEIINMVNEQPDNESVIQICEDLIPMNVLPKRIKSWIRPSECEIGETFIGTAHYVDKDGVIYISSVKQTHILKEMSREITKRYYNPYVMMNDKLEMLKPGDCVIVPYKDNEFYRGEIIRRSEKNPSQYLVRYVDYGTKVMINRHCIFLNVIGENIPIQANRFVLQNSMPVASVDEWNRDTLEMIHSVIVDKECQIKVTENTPYDEVKGIEIELLEELNGYTGDVENYLEKNKIIRFRQTEDEWPVPFKKSGNSFESGGVNAFDQIVLQILESLALQDEDIPPPIIEAPIKLFEEQVDATTQDTFNLLHKKVSFCHSAVGGYNSSSSSSEEEKEFDFKERKYSRNHRLVKDIVNIELRQYEYNEFDCIYHGAYESMPSMFLVEPIIEDIQSRYEQIMKMINNIPVNKLKSFHKQEKSVGKFCIVPTATQGWLRGKIVKYSEHYGKRILVDLVDKGKTEKVEFKNLRKIDILALKCPRKMMIVKSQTIDLADKDDSKLKGRRMKMIVKAYDEDNETPIVEFINIED